jgi:hypothetical protein
MTLICYYYSDKAAGLLLEREKIMKFLKFVLIAGLSIIIVLGSYLMINNTNDKDFASHLCKKYQFKFWRYLSIIISIIFFLITMNIN